MQRLITWTKLASAGAISIAVAMPVVAAPSTMGDDQSIYQGIVPTASGRVFSITGKMRTLYDSNILRRGDGFGLRAGDSLSDVRLSPSVTGEVGLPFGRQRQILLSELGELVPNSQKTTNFSASANCASAVGLGLVVT